MSGLTAFLTLVLTGCSGTMDVVPSGYRVDPASDRTLILSVPAGVGDHVAGVRVTEEDDKKVQVRVTVRHNDDNRPAVEVTLQASVTLRSPLAARAVLNEQGKAIPRRN